VKKLIFVTILCTFVWLGMAGCGDNDCPTCPDNKPPVEKEFKFLFSHVDTGYWVHTISTKDGRTSDSARYGEFPFWDMKYSSDGRFAYYTSTEAGNGAYHATWIADYLTGDTLAFLTGIGGHALSVSSDGGTLLISSGQTVAILSLPGLNVLYADSSGHHFRGCFNPRRQVAYVPVDDVDSLLVLQIESEVVSGFMSALKCRDGNRVVGLDAEISTEGDWLFLTVWEPSTGRRFFQIRSASTFELSQEYLFPFEVSAVHPDGRRVFFATGHLSETDPPLNGALYVLDLQTLLLQKVLDGADFSVPGPSYYGLSVDAMEITPDGKYGLLMSGGDSFVYGPFYKVDLRTYEIVDVFFLPNCVNRLIRMYPKEVNQGG
jgi:hypothetical protein